MSPHPLVARMSALEVVPNALGLFGLGQVGLAVRGPEGVIYIDPYLTDSDGAGGRLERAFPPPLAPSEVTNADWVLVTHDHVDHFDPATAEPIARASPGASFVGPFTCDFVALGLASERHRVAHAFEPFRALGATITPVPSAHTELEHSERGFPYLGYVIEWNGLTLYHAGDTVVWEPQALDGLEGGLIGVLSRWRIDAAFVPINGRDYFRTARGIIGNSDFREAAELAETLDVSIIFPTHFDVFPSNTANPAHFVDHLNRLNPSRRHHLLRSTELFYLVHERDGREST